LDFLIGRGIVQPSILIKILTPLRMKDYLPLPILYSCGRRVLGWVSSLLPRHVQKACLLHGYVDMLGDFRNVSVNVSLLRFVLRHPTRACSLAWLTTHFTRSLALPNFRARLPPYKWLNAAIGHAHVPVFQWALQHGFFDKYRDGPALVDSDKTPLIEWLSTVQ
jgi:hypothetical protein